ncbi:UNVERIFIED_CONTAM: hypothetical protein ITH22_24420, partial [Salmonella enterica subsp. enterica serovar Weltevreden]
GTFTLRMLGEKSVFIRKRKQPEEVVDSCCVVTILQDAGGMPKKKKKTPAKQWVEKTEFVGKVAEHGPPWHARSAEPDPKSQKNRQNGVVLDSEELCDKLDNLMKAMTEFKEKFIKTIEPESPKFERRRRPSSHAPP